MDILRISDLRIGFTIHGLARDVVKGVSLRVPAGKTVALVGESGSGKSVTMRALMRLLPKRRTVISGTVQVAGQDVLAMDDAALSAFRGRTVSMIFQEPVASLNPCFTVGFQIEEVLRIHLGLDKTARRKRAIELFEAVALPDNATGDRLPTISELFVDEP
eukprot:gene46969-57516_t